MVVELCQPTLQVSQPRNSLLQSMLAQLTCGSDALPPHTWQGTAASSARSSSLSGRGGGEGCAAVNDNDQGCRTPGASWSLPKGKNSMSAFPEREGMLWISLWLTWPDGEPPIKDKE